MRIANHCTIADRLYAGPILALATLCNFAATNSAAQMPVPAYVPTPETLVQAVAVFGKDNRRRLPRKLRSLRRSIGLVYSNRARSVCTGFCVADTMIATASHCLFRTAGERRSTLRDFRFTLHAKKGQPWSPIAGNHTRNPEQFVLAGSRRLRVEPPIDATKD